MDERRLWSEMIQWLVIGVLWIKAWSWGTRMGDEVGETDWRAGDVPPWKLSELSDEALITAIDEGPTIPDDADDLEAWKTWGSVYESLAKEVARRLSDAPSGEGERDDPSG